MVAIRPTMVQAESGQKFVVTRRFSGDGMDFSVGDIVLAHSEDWVRKAPVLIDQRFISQFLSEEDKAKTPVNLGAVIVPEKAEKAEKVEKVKATSKPVVEAITDSEVDALAASLS